MGLFSCCFAPEPATKYAIEDEPAPVSAVKYQPSPAPSAQREPLQVAAELEAAAQQFAKVPSDRDVEEPSSDIAAYHPYDDMPDAAPEAVRARTPQDNVPAEDQPDAPASAQDTDYPVQEPELPEEGIDAPLAAVMLVNGSDDAASKRIDDAPQGSTDAAPRAAAAAVTPQKATAGSYTTPQKKDTTSKRRPAIPTPDRTPGSANKTTPAKTPTARSASRTQQKQQPQKQSPAPSGATRPRSASKAAAVPAGGSPSVARPTKASLARAEASSRSLTAASPSAVNGWKY